MKISALTRKAIADVTRRRGRTMLVVLGIMIGVFGLTMINVANDFVGTAFVYSNSETAAPNIVISVQSIDPALAPALATVANVKVVQIDTQYQARWRIAAAPGHTNISIVGYQDFRQVRLNQFHLVSGRLPAAGEIVMEQSNNALQSFVLGDLVTIETGHGSQQLRVVGISRTIGRASPIISGNARGYMSTGALSQLTAVTGANAIEVQVYNTHAETQTTSALLAVLHAQHVTVFNSASVDTSANQTIVNALLTIMRVLSFIALVLTSFLILNTVTTLIAEQMRIVGSMKAIGGTRRTILRSYLLSIVIYGLLGTALGLGLGILGGYALSSYLAGLLVLDSGSPQVSPGVVLVSIAVGLGIPLVAALIPLWNGTRITVREAMANYGVSGGGSQGTLARHMTWVPQTTWLGFRSIFRKRGRAILTLLALTFSATAFLSIQTTTYSFDRGLADLVSVYHFDASVTTNPGDYAS
ncbi:MAG: FtsX-like permease family protein, partial [Chloroflexota bacterium]|nr:FtsX-like permease family protein [Chloroflexota bacterium]